MILDVTRIALDLDGTTDVSALSSLKVSSYNSGQKLGANAEVARHFCRYAFA